jgi:hypothetical protein
MVMSMMSLSVFAEDVVDTPSDDVETVEVTTEPETPAVEEQAEPTEETEEATEAVEPAAEPEEETEAVEPAEDAEEVTEEVEPAAEPEEETDEVEPAAEAEEETEAVESEEDAKEAAEEAARLAALERRWPKADYETVRTAGSYTVTVNVPEDAFPVEVSLTVSALEWSKLNEDTRALLLDAGLTEDDALLDICFIDEAGNEREPSLPVNVTIEAVEVEIAEVYHVEDEETVAKVAEDVHGAAEFEVEGFSIFAAKLLTKADSDKPDAAIEVMDAAELADAMGADEEYVAALLSNLGGWSLRATKPDDTVNLDFVSYSTSTDKVFVFTPKETKYDEEYDSWLCDFVISYEENVNADSVILVGAYNDMIASILMGMDFIGNNETKQPLISSVGFTFDYDTIAHVVSPFLCTAINVAPENIGRTINVSLVMWPSDENLTEGNAYIVTTVPYTFTQENLSTLKVGGTDYRYVSHGKSVDGDGNVVGMVFNGSAFVQQSAFGPHFTPVAEGVKIEEPVAMIGDVGYGTLAEAVAAAQDGDTVTLLKDVTASEVVAITKSLTLDGNGKKLTSSANRGIWLAAGDIDVTIKNLTILSSSNERSIQVNSDKDNVKLTIDHVTATATYYTINVCDGADNLDLTIRNSNLKGWSAINLWAGHGTAKVSNSTLWGYNDKDYNAGGWNNFGTVVLEGDTTGQTDLHSYAWTVELEDCTIIANTSGQGNRQKAILFNKPSIANSVTIKGGNTMVTYGQDQLVSVTGDNVLTITGGTFSTNPSAYVATGYAAVPSNASGDVTSGGDHWTVVRQYTVKFVDDSGKLLKSVLVTPGMTAGYVLAQAPTATKTADKSNTYTFSGWTPAVAAATGNATYTATFTATPVANSNVVVTVSDDGNTVTVTDLDANTTTTETTEKTTATIGTSSIETETKTSTVVTTGGSATVTKTVEDLTSAGNAEVTGDKTYTYTVKTATATEDTAEIAASAVEAALSASPNTSTTVTLKAEKAVATVETTKADIAKDTELETKLTAVANNAAQNVITTDKVLDSALSEKMTTLAEENEVTGKNVTVDVTLTLETKLTDYTVESAEATSVTFDVKPVMTTVVKIDGVQQGEAESEVVANDKLASSITVKLPVPASFGTVGQTIQIKHVADDGTVKGYITGTIHGDESGYYVEFTVTEFSSFELVPAGKVFVTFDANGGVGGTTLTLNVGEAVAAPTVTRSGYTFIGWSPEVPTTATTSAVYTAQWNAIVTPVSDDGGIVVPTGGNNSGEVEITDEETPLSDLPIFYVDVATGDWFRDAVAYVTNLGLMNGVGDQHFDPNSSTTRGMVATILMRMAKGEAVDLESFDDVANDAYYAEAAAWAVENDVFNGYEDSTFRGETVITREQLATVLYRYALSKGLKTDGSVSLDAYADGGKVSGYATEAMKWALANGILKGVSETEIDPTGAATRAQLATIMMRFNELTSDTL